MQLNFSLILTSRLLSLRANNRDKSVRELNMFTIVLERDLLGWLWNVEWSYSRYVIAGIHENQIEPLLFMSLWNG